MTDVKLSRNCVVCGREFQMLVIADYLYDYIERERKRGIRDADIQQAMINGGYKPVQARKLFADLMLVHCQECRSKPAAVQMPGIATRQQLQAQAQQTALAQVLPDPATMFADINQLVSIASAPVESRRRTFLEWMQGLDLEAIHIQKKLRAGQQADQLLVQRLALIRKYQEMVKAVREAQETQQADMERQTKLLRAHLEQLKVEEEIAQQHALREERLKTLQLEQTAKNTRLLAAINPPAAVLPPEQTDEDRARKVIDKQLLEFQTRAVARQRLITDFMKELRWAYDAPIENAEKALRIRAVMEAYRQGEEVLPMEVRSFLRQAEDDEGADGKR